MQILTLHIRLEIVLQATFLDQPELSLYPVDMLLTLLDKFSKGLAAYIVSPGFAKCDSRSLL